MIKRVTILLITIFLSNFCVAQNEFGECHDMDYLVQKTIDAINSKDPDAYFDLVNREALTDFFKKEAERDSSNTDLFLMSQNDELVSDIFKSSFNNLLERIIREFPEEQWNFELDTYRSSYVEETTHETHSTLSVRLIDQNKNRWGVMIYSTEYFDCHYIFEPIESYFMNGYTIE